MNPSSLIAVLAAGTWILSEVVERVSGGLTPLSLTLTALAFAGLAVGVWGTRGRGGATPGWRGATATTSLGFALMALLSLQMLSAGAAAHEEGLLFFAAIGTFAVGLLWLGGHAVFTGRHPRAVGLGFTAMALLSLGANGAEIGWLASTGNVGLSVLLGWMALPGLRRSVAQAVAHERAGAR